MIEFSRIYDLSLPSALIQIQKIFATHDECQALAKRFNILAVNEVSAEFKILHDQEEGCFKISGRLKGNVTQASIVSLAPVDELINEPIHVKIRLSSDDHIEENFDIESDEDFSEDIEYVQDTKVDIGELVSQYLALSLNPYPKKEGESMQDAGQRKNKVTDEPDKNPFDVLATLKKS